MLFAELGDVPWEELAAALARQPDPLVADASKALPDVMVLPGELLVHAQRAAVGIYSSSFQPATQAVALVPRPHLRLYGTTKEATRRYLLQIATAGTNYLRLEVGMTENNKKKERKKEKQWKSSGDNRFLRLPRLLHATWAPSPAWAEPVRPWVLFCPTTSSGE